MTQYNKINNIAGWVCFLIASTVYIMTGEPTVSFWDCGEFIATSYKLEVGHPPGAPLFMILARFFSLFSFGDVTLIARMVNIMSALASGFTILFLFWTVTHLARKIIIPSGQMTTDKLIIIIGCGLTGALAYAFSDTFWFSAVEGEVYATSSLFTAAVFWAILKWENVADEKYANRWLILIAYLMGLSIGIHLLNLLAIPAIVFVYYFKKYNVTRKGILLASLVAGVLVGSIMYIIIPGLVKVASWFELLFTNGFGLPYFTGVIFYSILLIGAIAWGIIYTARKKKVLLNTILLCITVIIIGYSSFVMIVIRSLADPPMDENNPDNMFALLSYLNREQYGDRPLLFGQYYNAPVIGRETGSPLYIQKDGKYVITDHKPVYNYAGEFVTVFPRMYSDNPQHVREYMKWGKIKGRPVKMEMYGEEKTENVPTFGENLRFFFRYQVGYMYFRYFMWNFAGKQNDIQGHGGILNGNWISGIPLIDNNRLGDQSKLSREYKSNRGRNEFYFLPLLLGLAGLFFHFKKHAQGFWLVMLLFFFTGLAIVIYLNQTPIQPRERDYAYAGSFYAFSVWIGIGVMAVYRFALKYLKPVTTAVLSVVLCLILVPVIMAAENWDDHDRSGRYTARDFACNYLNSCAPNAILFTNGDNDTFPLWYAQEVEGVRTDIRVVNLSLFNTDWYINQMRRRAYESAPVNFSVPAEKYIQGKRDYVYIDENPHIKGFINLSEVIDFVFSDNPQTRLPQDPSLNYFPTRNLKLPVDVAKVIRSGAVAPQDTGRIIKSIEWQLSRKYSSTRNYITKSELMTLDLISSNNWNRPVYFAITVGPENYLDLEEYFQMEGMAYRFVPIRGDSENENSKGMGRIRTDVMYNNMMNKFKWGNISDPSVYLDNENRRMAMNLRTNFARLAMDLLSEGKRDSALAVLNKCMTIIPENIIPLNYSVLHLIEAWYRSDNPEKANDMALRLADATINNLAFFLSLDKNTGALVEEEKQRELAVFYDLINKSKYFSQEKISKELENKLNMIIMSSSGK